jgi:hypothetical protein
MRMRNIVIYGLSDYNFFPPNYLINGMTFDKKLLNKYMFWSSVQLLTETFLILRRTERHKMVAV